MYIKYITVLYCLLYSTNYFYNSKYWIELFRTDFKKYSYSFLFYILLLIYSCSPLTVLYTTDICMWQWFPSKPKYEKSKLNPKPFDNLIDIFFYIMGDGGVSIGAGVQVFIVQLFIVVSVKLKDWTKSTFEYFTDSYHCIRKYYILYNKQIH